MIRRRRDRPLASALVTASPSVSAPTTTVESVTDPTWDPVEIDESNFVDDVAIEQMGTKEKYWVRIPDDDRTWLVKLPQVDTRDGTIAGEDWSEWTMQHLAAMLGVPTAVVRPARFQGRCASITRTMLANDAERLVHGNELLSAVFPGYAQGLRGENPGYTPAAVRTALDGVRPPIEAPCPVPSPRTTCGAVTCSWTPGRRPATGTTRTGG